MVIVNSLDIRHNHKVLNYRVGQIHQARNLSQLETEKGSGHISPPPLPPHPFPEDNSATAGTLHQQKFKTKGNVVAMATGKTKTSTEVWEKLLFLLTRCIRKNLHNNTNKNGKNSMCTYCFYCIKSSLLTLVAKGIVQNYSIRVRCATAKARSDRNRCNRK